jgi:PAS domain S-box-containing protein
MAKSRERKVEQVRQEPEDRFRLMADSMPDGITIVEDGQVVYVNNRLCELFGYSRKELLRMSGMELVALEEKERLQKILQAARKEGKFLKELEYWAVRKDGSRCYVRNRYSTSGETEGVRRRFVMTFDITEQKREAVS